MMTSEQRIKNLEVPLTKVDVILDTDAYNEIDDQFAIAYMLRSDDRINTKALYAAPFFNSNSTDPANGMEKSYDEIYKLLKMMNVKKDVFKGSNNYLPDENTPVMSDAARDLAERAEAYSAENPLYVVAIGAITNIASAILINPKIVENIVVIWLGGHGFHFEHTKEFNLRQDIAAARVVMKSGVPFVQLPCGGVVSEFRISKPELEYWLLNKNPLATYLAENTIEAAEQYAKDKPWTRVIWDVTAVAWLLNDNERFLKTRICKAHLPAYDGTYEQSTIDTDIRYTYYINRDGLMNDLIQKLLK